MKRLIILSVALLIITLINKACGDHPGTETSLVRLQTQRNGIVPIQSSNLNYSPKNLSLKSWKLHIERLEFSGKKQNGKQYFFATDYNGLLAAESDKEISDRFVEFSVPGGTYNPFEITFHTGREDTLAVLVIESEFQSPDNNDTLKIEFQFFNHNETIPVEVRADKEEGPVQFEKERINHIRFGIDMRHLLRALDPAKFDSLLTKREPDKEKIIVSANKNREIYLSLINRVNQSIHAFLQ